MKNLNYLDGRKISFLAPREEMSDDERELVQLSSTLFRVRHFIKKYEAGLESHEVGMLKDAAEVIDSVGTEIQRQLHEAGRLTRFYKKDLDDVFDM